MNKNLRNKYKSLIESKFKEAQIAARENPATAITKKAREEQATKTHAAIQDALKSGKIVTIRARKTPDFEAPAVDHNLVVHQGVTMLVDPKGRGRIVANMAPSATGHISVHFKEKGRRAAQPMHLHAGSGSEGDMIVTDSENSPYRVSLVGGSHVFRGLPDMNEDFNYESDQVRIMNKLEEALLNKKKIDNIKTVAKGTLAGLALAGAFIGGHRALTSKPTLVRAAQPVASIGSGQVKSSVATATQTKSAHEMAARVIREREGFRSSAYLAPEGKWTIGYGNTTWSSGKAVKQGDTITRDVAEKEFEHHVKNKVVPHLEKLPHWGKMSEHQKAGLISFAYNAGEYFHKSPGYKTITAAINDPEKWNQVPTAMALYNKATNPKTGKKETLPGLVTRRKYEGELWSGKEPEFKD